MKNQNLIIWMMGLLFILMVACGGIETTKSESGPERFYVGSSDGSQDYSVYLCELNPGEGTIAVLDSFAGAIAPSYLDISEDGNTLYSVDDRSIDPEKQMQSVNAFHINRDDLTLKYMNSQSSYGRGPCHVHAGAGHLFVANYNSGHAAVIAVAKDGKLGSVTAVMAGEGSGPVESRQKGPHAHQVMLDPSGKFLLVPDLGTDRVMNYVFDSLTGGLSINPQQGWFGLPPGAGPRHLVFHPSGKYLYIANELNSTVTACSFDGRSGEIALLNGVSTVEVSHEGDKYPAAVRVHPNGKFLYASTRGENSCLSVFRIEENGAVNRIQVVEHVPLWPRDFNLDPLGEFLLVAGEKSGTIALYRVDADSGLVTDTDALISIPSPGSILFP